MTRFAASLAALFAALAVFAAPPALAAPPAAEDAASLKKAILADRAQDERWLKSDPQSYLAAVKRVDFGGKAALTVGSAADADVKLDGLSARALRITAQADGFLTEAVDPATTFTVGKSSAAAATRSARTGPESLGVGRYRLRLSHQGYPAVIVFDPRSPRFKEYHGMRYFPVDLSYRFVVPLLPDASAEKVAIRSTHSADRKAERVGWFELDLHGTRVRLSAMRLLEPGAGPDDLTILFRDKTTGKESYSVGRYVDPVRRPDGRYVVDFNMAYNPACAFSAFYNCPIPPKENYLAAPIRAGAKDPRYH